MKTQSPAEDFWENHYKSVSPESSGRPSSVLVAFVEERRPGHALELGCAKGDDAVWLARQGWRVTAADVSQTALSYAEANARRAGIADRITFASHDFSRSLPAGEFDLVSALFLPGSDDFPRIQVLRRAADAVSRGGLLLIASHGSVAPWSWADPDTVFPTAEETFRDIDLDMKGWRRVFVGSTVRQATGPDGQTAEVTDEHLVLERR